MLMAPFCLVLFAGVHRTRGIGKDWPRVTRSNSFRPLSTPGCCTVTEKRDLCACRFTDGASSGGFMGWSLVEVWIAGMWSRTRRRWVRLRLRNDRNVSRCNLCGLLSPVLPHNADAEPKHERDSAEGQDRPFVFTKESLPQCLCCLRSFFCRDPDHRLHASKIVTKFLCRIPTVLD